MRSGVGGSSDDWLSLGARNFRDWLETFLYYERKVVFGVW